MCHPLSACSPARTPALPGSALGQRGNDLFSSEHPPSSQKVLAPLWSLKFSSQPPLQDVHQRRTHYANGRLSSCPRKGPVSSCSASDSLTDDPSSPLYSCFPLRKVTASASSRTSVAGGMVVAEGAVPRSGAVSACVCGAVGKGVELGGYHLVWKMLWYN